MFFSPTWSSLPVMDAASAAEFCLIFVFEVYVEKEIYLLGVETSSLKEQEEVRVSATPVLGEPNNHDVLFGRGGMTNRCVIWMGVVNTGVLCTHH